MDENEKRQWEQVCLYYPKDLVNRDKFKFCIFKVQNAKGHNETSIHAWFVIETPMKIIQIYSSLQAPKNSSGRTQTYDLLLKVDGREVKVDKEKDRSTLRDLFGHDETVEFILRLVPKKTAAGQKKPTGKK